MFRSLGHPGFRLFFFGQFLSLCGTWMQQTAQAWLVYRLTRDPLMLGLVAFVGQFPVFFFGFYSGWMVDRMDHLRLVRATQLLSMVQAAALAVLALGGWIEVWHVCALAFFLGLVNAVDMPARQVLIGELVPAEHRHNAIALNSTIVNASRIVGPALAGLVIGWSGEGACFAINAVSYASVLAALYTIREARQAPRRSEGSPWEEIGRGVGYALGRAPIRAVLFVLTAFSLAGLPIYVLLPIFAEEVLGSGARGLGLLSSAAGLGATVGALALARLAGSKGLGAVVIQSVLLYGLALGAFALSRSLWLSCALMWLVGWCAIQVLAGINTLLQELSSDEYRGRVMSFYAMIFIGLAPLGSFMVGTLASRIGTAPTVLLEAFLCVVLGIAYRRRLPDELSRGAALTPPVGPSSLPPAL